MKNKKSTDSGMNAVIHAMPIKLLLAGLSAIMCVASFPKIELWPLAWVGLVPLLFVLESSTPKSSLLFGWFFGTIHSIGVAYWIFHALYINSSAGLITSLLFLTFIVGGFSGLYFGIFSFGANRLIQKYPSGIIRAISIASCWVIVEYCRSHLFSGFPWGLLGHTQYRWLHFIQIADIAGVYGISFLLVLGNVSFFEALKYRRGTNKPFSCLLLCIFLMSSVIIYGSSRISHLENKTEEISNTKTIAVIQGSISQDQKWKSKNQHKIINTYLSITEKALQKGPQLVIWPETVIGSYLQNKIPLEISRVLEKYNATLILGGPRYTGTPNNYTFYNSAYHIDGKRIITVYDKIHLLPFGEYFPLGFIDVLKSQFSGPREYSPGKKNILFKSWVSVFGTLICFEIIFPDRVRALVKQGANFLVNISNDAWFGKTSAHYQHFSIAVFRAVEFRRQIIRASNTGISGFIDSTGRIEKKIMPFKDGYLTSDLKKSDRETIYCRYGDVLVFLCTLWLGVTLLKKTKKQS